MRYYWYIFVYLHMSMYPSPPVDVAGCAWVGGATPHTIWWWGREHKTRDHIYIYIYIYLFIYLIFIYLFRHTYVYLSVFAYTLLKIYMYIYIYTYHIHIYDGTSPKTHRTARGAITCTCNTTKLMGRCVTMFVSTWSYI